MPTCVSLAVPGRWWAASRRRKLSLSNRVADVSETGTLIFVPSGHQPFRILAERCPGLAQETQHLRRELFPKSEHVYDHGREGRSMSGEQAASPCEQMFNPLRHVLEPGVLVSGPAIRLQRFRIPDE